MASVFDLESYRAARNIRTHTHIAGGVVRQTKTLIKTLESTEQQLLINKNILSKVGISLDSCKDRIRQNQELSRLCQKACELDDVGEMMSCYEKIIKTRKG